MREVSVRLWEERCAPLITKHLRKRRRGKLGKSWYVDETCIKVKGEWCYLYWAIDQDGPLIDCRMSKQRDMDATKAFFQSALELSNKVPDRVTTDQEVSYPRAIREELSEEVLHRINKYLNNLIEQGHRGIKQRYGSMKGCAFFEFCKAYDELRNYYKSTQRGQKKSLKDQRVDDMIKTENLTAALMIA